MHTVAAAAVLFLWTALGAAQELTPRAYWPAPKGTRVGVLGSVHAAGDVLFDPSIPLYGVDSEVNVAVGSSDFSSDRIAQCTIQGPDDLAEISEIELSTTCTLVNVMYDWLHNLIVGVEHNRGRKDTVHTGTIDTGEEVLCRLDKGRVAQRISIGMFSSF